LNLAGKTAFTGELASAGDGTLFREKVRVSLGSESGGLVPVGRGRGVSEQSPFIGRWNLLHLDLQGVWIVSYPGIPPLTFLGNSWSPLCSSMTWKRDSATRRRKNWKITLFREVIGGARQARLNFSGRTPTIALYLTVQKPRRRPVIGNPGNLQGKKSL